MGKGKLCYTDFMSYDDLRSWFDSLDIFTRVINIETITYTLLRVWYVKEQGVVVRGGGASIDINE